MLVFAKEYWKKVKKGRNNIFPKHFWANIGLAGLLVGQLDVVCGAQAAIMIERLLAVY